MKIIIDNKSGTPIYDQIYSHIKSEIICGSVSENEALPSIRSLAKDLQIRVITTKRAYDELEKEGFIYTKPSKGCFVAKQNIELIAYYVVNGLLILEVTAFVGSGKFSIFPAMIISSVPTLALFGVGITALYAASWCLSIAFYTRREL